MTGNNGNNHASRVGQASRGAKGSNGAAPTTRTTPPDILQKASILNQSPTSQWIANNLPNEDEPKQGHAAFHLVNAEHALITAAYTIRADGKGIEILPISKRTSLPAKEKEDTSPHYADPSLRAAASAFSIAVNHQLSKKGGGSSFKLPSDVQGDPAQHIVNRVQKLVQPPTAIMTR